MKNNLDYKKIKEMKLTHEKEKDFIQIINTIAEFIDLLENEELDNLVTSNMGFRLNKNASKKLPRIIDEIVQIFKSDDNDFKTLIKYLKETWSGEKFWDNIYEVTNKLLESYKETSFLRDQTDDVIRMFFRELVDNQILVFNQTEFVIEQLQNQFNEEQLEVGIKIIEYSISLIIEERYSFDLFISTIIKAFGLNNRIAELLWDLIVRNKSELINRYIIAEIVELNKKLNSLISE